MVQTHYYTISWIKWLVLLLSVFLYPYLFAGDPCKIVKEVREFFGDGTIELPLLVNSKKTTKVDAGSQFRRIFGTEIFYNSDRPFLLKRGRHTKGYELFGQILGDTKVISMTFEASSDELTFYLKNKDSNRIRSESFIWRGNKFDHFSSDSNVEEKIPSSNVNLEALNADFYKFSKNGQDHFYIRRDGNFDRVYTPIHQTLRELIAEPGTQLLGQSMHLDDQSTF